MLLVLMKALWDLEIRVVMKGARREAIILEIIFATTWIRLIGLK
jgi:hypothetical protein